MKARTRLHLLLCHVPLMRRWCGHRAPLRHLNWTRRLSFFHTGYCPALGDDAYERGLR